MHDLPLIVPVDKLKEAAAAIRTVLTDFEISPSSRLETALALAEGTPARRSHENYRYTALQLMDLFEIQRLAGAMALLKRNTALNTFKHELVHFAANEQFRHQSHLLHVAARCAFAGAVATAADCGADILVDESYVIECKTREDSKPITTKWIENILNAARKQTKTKWKKIPAIVSLDLGLIEDQQYDNPDKGYRFADTPGRSHGSKEEWRRASIRFLEKTTRVVAVVVTSFRFENGGQQSDTQLLVPNPRWTLIWKQGGKPVEVPLSKSLRTQLGGIFSSMQRAVPLR